MYVDSHVNLHGERYEEDLPEVLQRAEEAGIGAMLLISDRLDSIPEITEIAETNPAFSRSVGVHPHHAKDYADLTAETLIELAQPEKVVGIGECGLDYHYEYSPRADQEKVFAAHITASQKTQLPLIVHTREADDDMQRMLEEAYAERNFPLLLHCYTSGRKLMEAGLAMGGYVAFSGIVTFKRADEVRALAKDVPLDRLLIETDCPFLAPVPHRGRRNEPAYLPQVAEMLAEVRGEDVKTIEEATTENYFRLFERAHRP
ncbi:TatD family hydrolase [Parvularcula sp. ZS-1/3]|uniref:TatD family hydrolase n=1 Tax=Parvularcula mediterranea TaxID=2732508 RepID=A0A7Y3RIX1_9PROT|nr:TatD family hydrolase [Parvularcula mediterranea]NNU14914.1 TatD family hydrolase [Parvularcula mediterranea]